MVVNWEVVFLILQAVFLFMLVLGVPLSKGLGNKKTFIRHGYLTIAALVLHTISVIIIMVYLAINGLLTLVDLPILNSFTIIFHSILGTTAMVMGFIVVGFWVSKPLGTMNCYRAKKLMLPTLIVWAISLILGYIIYFLELF
jgi:hypothetical protein